MAAEADSGIALTKKILSALFYAMASLLLTTINKTVLTSFGFPSYELLGFGQIVAAVLFLRVGRTFSVISFPDLDWNLAKKVVPLSFIFVGNLFFGLGGTKKISLPMFTVLRRFTVLFTMIAEFFMFRTRPSLAIQMSVYGMIIGSIIAASSDLSFEATGYFFIIMNDLFTAANGVYMKRALNSKELGEYGLLYYNSVFLFVPIGMYLTLSGELEKVVGFHGWTEPAFLLLFTLSSVMGLVNNYAILLCTSYNSALTTTVIGALKNILTVYIGMGIGGDYVFSWTNFMGLNFSVVASLIYSYVVFSESESRKAKPTSIITA